MYVHLAALDLTVRELAHLRAAVGHPMICRLHKVSVHRERERMRGERERETNSESRLYAFAKVQRVEEA